MYADDHQIYTSGDTVQVALQKLKSETQKVTQWYTENLLRANPSKYQILVIDPKPSAKEPAEEIALEIEKQVVVTSSDRLSIPGVSIDKNLSFSEHISAICK